MKYGNYSFIGAKLIRGEALISFWIPEAAALIRGQHLFEVLCLLEQKSALLFKFLYEPQEVVIKLFNDYSSIAAEAKYKTIHEKGIPSMSARIAHIAKFFACKICGYSNLKIFSPKRILQRFPIALAQVKAGNASENLLNEIK